jgi:hypothetical protein
MVDDARGIVGGTGHSRLTEAFLGRPLTRPSRRCAGPREHEMDASSRRTMPVAEMKARRRPVRICPPRTGRLSEATFARLLITRATSWLRNR